MTPSPIFIRKTYPFQFLGLTCEISVSIKGRNLAPCPCFSISLKKFLLSSISSCTLLKKKDIFNQYVNI